MIIEAFGFLFAIFALSRVYLQFQQGRISWGMFLVWFGVWGAIIFFLVYPSGVDVVSKTLGIQRPLDFMLVVGLIIVYYLNFRLYIAIEELHSDVAVLVRELGIQGEKREGDD